MIDFLTKFIIFIEDNLIRGIFICVLLIILVKHFFQKINTHLSLKIIKWIIIIYSSLNLISIILSLFDRHSDINIFSERATGAYWWAHWLMLIMSTVFPLLLLNKKLGNKIYFLFFIALLMNIGWLFESFVIHVTNIHRDYIPENYNPYLPNNTEVLILIKGFLLGLIFLLIENGIIKRYRTLNLKH